jgi:hypothetical protein
MDSTSRHVACSFLKVLSAGYERGVVETARLSGYGLMP